MANPVDANAIAEFRIARTLLSFGERAMKQGLLVPNDLQWAIDDPTEMQRVVDFLKEGRCGPLIDAHQVRVALNDDPQVDDSFLAANPDYHGPSSMLSHLTGGNHIQDVDLSAAEAVSRVYGEVPALRPGFLTFFDAGLSVMQMLELCTEKKWPFFGEKSFPLNEGETIGKKYPWACKYHGPGWTQVRFSQNPMLKGQTVKRQLELFPRSERRTTARTVIMAMLINALVFENTLFQGQSFICSDAVSCNGQPSFLVVQMLNKTIRLSIYEQKERMRWKSDFVASESVL